MKPRLAIYRSWGSSLDMPRTMLDSILLNVETAPLHLDELESVWLGLCVQTYGRWLVQRDDGRWYVEAHPVT